jgi:hypothetical protein
MTAVTFITDLIGVTSKSERAMEAQGQAIVKAAGKTKAALEEQVKGFDNQIAAAKAAGKSTVELEKAKQDAIIATNDKIQEQLIAFVRSGGQLNEEQKKLFTESVAAEKAAIQEKKIVTITADKEATDKAKEKAKERAAANLAAIKTIEDAQIAAIKDEELRLFSTEVKANERRVKEIKDGKESEELKRQEKEAQAVLFEQNIAKINLDAAAKRKAEEEKIAAEKKAADEKAAAEKKAADEKALADKNAKLTAEAELAVLKQGNDLADLTNQLTVKRDIELQNTSLTAAQKLLIEEKYSQDVAALNKASETAKFDMAKKGLEGLQSLSDIFFTVKLNKTVKGSKEEEAILKKQFELNKAFQLSMTAVQGIQNGIDAYGAGLKAASVTGIGAATAPIVGAAYAAISGLATLASLAKIKSTKFGGGASGGGGAESVGGGAPSIPPPPTIATPENNTNKTTSFDETGKNLNFQGTPTPTINVKASVGVDEITSKSNRVEVLENQSTF